jgi:hypothetical protein
VIELHFALLGLVQIPRYVEIDGVESRRLEAGDAVLPSLFGEAKPLQRTAAEHGALAAQEEAFGVEGNGRA